MGDEGERGSKDVRRKHEAQAYRTPLPDATVSTSAIKTANAWKEAIGDGDHQVYACCRQDRTMTLRM
jgi:hypothetical protein